MLESAGNERARGRGSYVYAVVRARDAGVSDDVAGVDPRFTIRIVEQAGLAAIVSEVALEEFGEGAHGDSAGLAWLEEKARAHEEVVHRALRRGAVLPMRFGTIVGSDEDVRGLLERDTSVFADLLRRVDGKNEWGVKGLVFREQVARWVEARSPDAAALHRDAEEASGGRSYFARKQLERLLDAEVRRTVAACVDDAHERIAACASAARLNPPQQREVSGRAGETVLNGAYLVPREREDEFRTVVAELGREYADVGLTFLLTGPWPPYNFVQAATEAGWTTS